MNRFLAVASILASATLAHADDYPITVADRPLVHPDGMTTVDASIVASEDGLFVPVGASHAIDGVEPFVTIYTRLNHTALTSVRGGVRLRIDDVQAIDLGGGHGFSDGGTAGTEWAYAQYVGKLKLAPHRFSVVGAGGVEVDHFAYTAASSVNRGDLYASVTAELQVAPGFAFTGSGNAWAGKTFTPATTEGRLGVGCGMVAVLGSVDVYADVGYGDITGAPFTRVSLGVASRF
ncbi:MAG TPA: hypothetical protein VL463_06160 [Kofleriaceae bacterium]|nr:hypothetical protein [Kofleriaceae bacterium]